MVNASKSELRASRIYNNWLERSSNRYLIIVAFFLLLPFQDLPYGQEKFGRLGCNASLPFLIVWFIASLSSKWWTEIKASSAWSTMIILSSFLGYQSICSCVLLLTELPQTFRNEVLWTKALKIMVTYVVWVLAILQGYQTARTNFKKIKDLLLGLFVSISVLILIDYYGAARVFSSSPIFHLLSGYEDGGRIRLFSSEASNFGSLFTSMGFLAAISSVDKKTRFFVVTTMVLFQFLILSRGTMLCLSGATLLGLLIRNKGVNHRLSVADLMSVISVLIAVISSIEFAWQNLNERLDIDTSVSTRTILTMSSFHALKNNPFGGGWSGYLFYGEEWVRNALVDLSSIYSDASLVEVVNLLENEDDKNLAGQNLLTTFIWWGGFAGIFVYLSFSWSIIRSAVKESDLISAIGGWYLFLLFTTCSTTFYDYSAAFLCGVIIQRYNKSKSISKLV